MTFYQDKWKRAERDRKRDAILHAVATIALILAPFIGVILSLHR